MNFAQDACHVVHVLQHGAHRRASCFGNAGTSLDLARRFADQLLDFFRGASRVLRQVAHFGRHHGKAAPLAPRPRRLHRGVQGQDIRLEGDAVDHAGDVDDARGRRLDRPHAHDQLTHGLRALGGHAGRGLGQRIGLLRIGVVAGDGARQFIHRRHRLAQRFGLALGADRQVLVAFRDFAGGGVDCLRPLQHLRHGARDAVRHAIECVEQAADFIGAGVADGRAQVAMGHLLGQRRRLPERAHQVAGQEPCQATGHGQRRATQCQQQRLAEARFRCRRVGQAVRFGALVGQQALERGDFGAIGRLPALGEDVFDQTRLAQVLGLEQVGLDRGQRRLVGTGAFDQRALLGRGRQLAQFRLDVAGELAALGQLRAKIIAQFQAVAARDRDGA